MGKLSKKKFLESGMLEMYAIGELPTNMTEEVEEWLLEDEDVRMELDRIEDIIEKIGRSGAIEPPASVKAGVFDKIQKLLRTSGMKRVE